MIGLIFEDIPGIIWVVVTIGYGGNDKLEYRPAPVPKLDLSEVLVRFQAAGMINTKINACLGWYSSSVTVSTA